jgi:hypothetical protein
MPDSKRRIATLLLFLASLSLAGLALPVANQLPSHRAAVKDEPLAVPEASEGRVGWTAGMRGDE